MKTLAVLLQNSFWILGIRIDDRERRALELMPREANQPTERFVDGHNVAVFIGEPHAIHGVFPHGVEEHFGTSQRLFGANAFEGAAAVISQRLQRTEIALRECPQGIALDREN